MGGGGVAPGVCDKSNGANGVSRPLTLTPDSVTMPRRGSHAQSFGTSHLVWGIEEGHHGQARSDLSPGGSPPLQSGGQNQRRPTSGQDGYITPAAGGVPTASERGAKSEVAHKWARWLQNPCRLGGPHRFTARGRIRGGPQEGKVAT